MAGLVPRACATFSHLLLALVLFIPSSTVRNTYNVFPTCPGDDTECLTLSDAAKEANKYLDTDTTLAFHPGDHHLQGEVVSLAYISGLTLMSCNDSSGSSLSNPRILCDNSSFSFSGVSDLQMELVSFVSCRIELSSTDAKLISIRFENSMSDYGGAVAVYSGSNIQFSGESVFIGNQASIGGAVYVQSSDLTFSGNSTFLDNAANRNNGDGMGGALYVHSSGLTFSGSSTFLNNAASIGGAVYAESSGLTFSGNVWFENNTSDDGGVVYLYSGSMQFSGDSGFVDNRATRVGGVVCFQFATLTFSGTSTFVDNTATDGGAFATMGNSMLTVTGNSRFINNSAVNSGGVVFALSLTTISFNGISNFFGNRAHNLQGAVVYALDSTNFRFNGTSTFSNNIAPFGAALYALFGNFFTFDGTSSFVDNGHAILATERNTFTFIGNSHFFGNRASCEDPLLTSCRSGGALYVEISNTLSFSGDISFTENAALFGGGIFAGRDSNVFLTGSIEFSRNEAISGGGIFVEGGSVTMNGNALFSGNSASESGFGGAIHAVSSRVSLQGNYLITENTARLGGGLALSGVENRLMLLRPGTHVSYVGNIALGRGGAIYVEDNPSTYCILEDSVKTNLRELCFFQTYDKECTFSTEVGHVQHDISLTFMNNTATGSGDTMYGGSLENCGLCSDYGQSGSYILGTTAFEELTSEATISNLEVASDPLRVCICENKVPDCTVNSKDVAKYPGQTLSVCVVAVGQLNGVVPSVIRAVPDGLYLSKEYTTQVAENSKKCSELQYPLNMNRTVIVNSATLELYSDEPCSTSGYPLTVQITFLPCPTGFSLSGQGGCDCDDRLKKYTQDCDIANQTITRPGGSSFWVGVDRDNISDSEGLILHPHCPFDYCTDETVEFPLNKADIQCRNRRSGVLCGACQSGYSLALGSSRCISDCSNKFLGLLLPFAAAGLALVIFLFLCNITVAMGTISGLIFFANVLAINQSVFFPTGDHNISTNILTVFIAWVNLDLGIETCFSTSLDIYIRTWLQFAFPFYIWLLVGLIVYLAEISTTFAKLLSGTNPVAVLATLFLLSYSKLLRTTMASFALTTLSYPRGDTRVVWLYDGNIGFWDGKHVALILFSLVVILIFFLPYTLLLLCGQWIQSRFQLRWLSPTKQLYLKSFFDAYYAPYKDRQRYWTGLLLLVRFFVLLMSNIINIQRPQDPHTNLLVMVIIVSCLLAWISHGVYKKWYLDALEASFIFNLIILAVGTYQVRLSGGNQAALVYTSTGIAFVTFIVIGIIAVMQRFRKAACSKALSRKIGTLRQLNKRKSKYKEEPTQQPPTPVVNISLVDVGPAYTVVNYAEYRETALGLMSHTN